MFARRWIYIFDNQFINLILILYKYLLHSVCSTAMSNPVWCLPILTCRLWMCLLQYILYLVFYLICLTDCYMPVCLYVLYLPACMLSVYLSYICLSVCLLYACQQIFCLATGYLSSCLLYCIFSCIFVCYLSVCLFSGCLFQYLSDVCVIPVGGFPLTGFLPGIGCSPLWKKTKQFKVYLFRRIF